MFLSVWVATSLLLLTTSPVLKGVLLACMSVYYMQRPEKAIRGPGIGGTDGCELLCELELEPRSPERVASALNC